MRKMVWIVMAGLLVAGCVERRLHVISEPPEAEVYLDGRQVGHTPFSMPFTFYGSREITVKKPGFGPAQTVFKLEKPWYQVFPFDFFSELVWPGRIVDRHYCYLKLPPPTQVELPALIGRADQFRQKAQQEIEAKKKEYGKE